MGITLFFVCLGKCTLNYFSVADMLSVIGGLTFLCFIGLRVIITPRTQHTLFAGHVLLDNVSAIPAFLRADLYMLTIRQKISVSAIVFCLQKLRMFITRDDFRQIFLDNNITLFSMCFCFIAFNEKLITFSF